MPIINGTNGNDVLNDTSGNDTINALGGDDSILVSLGGIDSVDGGPGSDTLEVRPNRGITFNALLGTASWGTSQLSFAGIEHYVIWGSFNESDDVTTGAGNDVFRGFMEPRNGGPSVGSDRVDLGAGFDLLNLVMTQSYYAVVMTITGSGPDGYNGSVVLANGVRVDFTGVEAFNVRGADRPGDGGNDILRGGDGDDVFWGNNGSDLIEGGDGDDVLLGGGFMPDSGNDHLYGGDGNDSLNGAGGHNRLFGEGGDDLLIGTGGIDEMDGGAGDDRLVTHDVGNIVNGGAGFDTLETDNRATLEAPKILTVVQNGTGWDGSYGNTTFTGIERFIVITHHGNDDVTTGSGDDIFTLHSGNDLARGGAGNDTFDGGDGDDELHGEAGNDYIDGKAGADRMFGGTGDDTYVVDNTLADQLFENAGEGNDTVVTTRFEYSLTPFAHVENLSALTGYGQRLTGNNGDNVITGGAGYDTLVGLGGADTLRGGKGNDSYLVGDSRTVIVETADGGYDTAYVTVDYRLTPGAFVEVITPYERELTDPLRITGNEFANTIYGNAGNNVLTGLGGLDLMYGLAGDDAYLVDDDLDRIFEVDGQGYDTVYTEGDFALNNFSSVEALTAYDRETTNALTLFGNNLNNVIYGNNGSNALFGGGGTDRIYGLAGDDRIVVDSADDVVIEFAGGGTDTVYTTVTYALAATDAEVEVLTVYDRDTANAVNLTGNGIANTIYGNAGANTIDGKGGSDLLFGMGGADSFAFTSALGAGNADSIFGFVGGAGGDRILLDDAVFTGLAPGALPAGAFLAGSAAADADDRIIYNSATGQLFFDADGNGGGAQILFATLEAGTVLTASDFMVI